MDKYFPSLSKAGIIVILNYISTKYQEMSDIIKMHYIFSKYESHIDLTNCQKQELKNIINESKKIKKVHFVLLDSSPTNDKSVSDHITFLIIINGLCFNFDSSGISFLEDEYGAVGFKQQSEQTSCKSISLGEMEKSIIELKTFVEKYGQDNTVDNYCIYLKSFYSENKKAFFVTDFEKIEDDITKKIEDGSNYGKRRAIILPFWALNYIQSKKNLKYICDHYKTLKNYYEECGTTNRELEENTEKLSKLVEECEKNKDGFNINALKERVNHLIYLYCLKDLYKDFDSINATNENVVITQV